MRRVLRLVLAAVVTVLMASPAHALPERRVALIIGNDAYKGLKPLDNAANDASAMAAELKGLGWETTVKVNAGRREMNGAMADFGEQLAGGAVGLFYYAGHGIEAGGQIRSAFRVGYTPGYRGSGLGFRLARTLL